MARYTGPKRKYERRFGLIEKDKKKGRFDSARQAGKRVIKRKRAKSDFGAHLEEKQKLKFIYGILERQLARYIRESFKVGRNPTEYLLQVLETRLDNVVYRLGFAKTRREARQLVSHKHIKVGDRKMNISSYNVKVGEVILLEEKIFNRLIILGEPPKWLERIGNTGKVLRILNKDELPKDVNAEYAVEFYRKA